MYPTPLALLKVWKKWVMRGLVLRELTRRGTVRDGQASHAQFPGVPTGPRALADEKLIRRVEVTDGGDGWR